MNPHQENWTATFAVAAELCKLRNDVSFTLPGSPPWNVVIDQQHVQWAARFAVASELSKRGCAVTFAMGAAAAVADLLAFSPDGQMFLVRVKGLGKPGFWQIDAEPRRPNLYYALCLAPKREKNLFFLMRQADVSALMFGARAPGERPGATPAGVSWEAALPHRDKWSVLPLGGDPEPRPN
ncbi:MAG TPA: hypothetical protein VFE13_06295 [Caulobacteraceae bacterium]|nr:hypothetical protein [Caulobacteraceae bacterium]